MYTGKSPTGQSVVKILPRARGATQPPLRRQLTPIEAHRVAGLSGLAGIVPERPKQPSPVINKNAVIKLAK